MTKLNRYLIIALVLQLVILAITQLSSRGPTVAKPRKLFDKVDVEKVTWLRIEQGGDTKSVVELAKQDGRWVLKSGGGYPAKKDKVTELLGKLPGLSAGPPVTTRPSHHRKLEVADDKFQRRLAFKLEGGKEHRFLLGSSPGIKNVHLRMAGSDEVVLVRGLTAWDASATAADWVESDYFKVERDRVVALTLTNKNGEIRLEKKEGSWTLEGMEEGSTLKQTDVDSLLSSASSVALKEPVGREIRPAFELGQGKVLARLTLLVEKKADKKADKPPTASPPVEAPPARVTHTLTVGAKAGDDYYVKSGASAFVVKAAQWAVEPLLNKKPSDLVETREEKEAKEKEKEKKEGESQGG